VETAPARSAAESEVRQAVAEYSRVQQYAAQQLPRRAAEHQARVDAVQFASDHYRSCRRAARCLRISPRTLAYWKRRQARGELTAQLRGRPCREPTHQERAVVQTLLEDAGPGLGVPTLRHYYPEAPRCVWTDLVREYRRAYQATHRDAAETLHWHHAGTVWAMDHSEPSRPIDGWYSQIFAVRDLASGMQLAWTPVFDATAEEALAILEALVRVHGPPLVLKSDNGKALTQGDIPALLEAHAVTSLMSPVYRPQYNGGCEAGVKAMKIRTEDLAVLEDRSRHWTADDLAQALPIANEYHHTGPSSPTRQERWRQRSPITPAQRAAFQTALAANRASLSGAGPGLTKTQTRTLERRTVAQTLVELGLLIIHRRPNTPPKEIEKAARLVLVRRV
jgi:hypothetical protein